MFYAHSADRPEHWEPLADHLALVAKRAADLAFPFGAQEEARAAGLLHDLGKYGDLFQRRLRGLESGIDHWSVGAWAALLRLREAGRGVALAVHGHHTGLQGGDPDSLRALQPTRLAAHHPQQLRLSDTDVELLVRRFQQDGLVLPALPGTPFTQPPAATAVTAMLSVRLLFSALVDADYLESEAHFARSPDGHRTYRPSGPSLRPEAAIATLEAYVRGLGAAQASSADIATVRQQLFEACRTAASFAPGTFTLTAPTGAGKTLAMLAFALEHARLHGFRRVVVAIPYLSIIEQTARVYRAVFAGTLGSEYVLEHHSLAGTRGPDASDSGEPGGEGGVSTRARYLAENWDAPLVVTTTVQLLESLFANRPSACRKLHQLSRAVVLLDEVQTLPRDLAVLTLAALSALSERCVSTVVMATATQPAFRHLHSAVIVHAASGWGPREIVPPALKLERRSRRAHVTRLATPFTWEELADQLLDTHQVLCIVNLKRHALALIEVLRRRGAEGLLHLSTNLCPAHRTRVLDEVRHRLRPEVDQPCVLVSTQCVEAGVDVDFPAVWRAFGPLDAVAQAAGRCNRHGLRPEPGAVTVFEPVDGGYPSGDYQQAADVTRLVLGDRLDLDLSQATIFDDYYRTLYNLTGLTTATHGRSAALVGAITRLDFAETARLYRLIPKDAINVVVPYDLDAYADLRRRLEIEARLTANWIATARTHAVGIFRPRPHDAIHAYLGLVPVGPHETATDWFIYLDADGYDRDLIGLMQAPEVWIA